MNPKPRKLPNREVFCLQAAPSGISLDGDESTGANLQHRDSLTEGLATYIDETSERDPQHFPPRTLGSHSYPGGSARDEWDHLACQVVTPDRRSLPFPLG